jgi:hypothetical protein
VPEGEPYGAHSRYTIAHDAERKLILDWSEIRSMT